MDRSKLVWASGTLNGNPISSTAGLAALEVLSRPGLYDTAHSGNLVQLASAHLSVRNVMHHPHRFTFTSFASAAEYLATSPKYRLPAAVADDPAAITATLRARLRDGPVTSAEIAAVVAS